MMYLFGGGIGLGFLFLFIECLVVDYGKKFKLEFCVYLVFRVVIVVVEFYNVVLIMYFILEYVDCLFMMDNEVIYDFCCINLDVE